MKITAIRTRRVTGTLEYEGAFREERQARPIDLYESMVTAAGGLPALPSVGEGRYRVEAVFLEIETDEGVTGRAGTITAETARAVRQFEPLLLGQDPFSTELLWDAMYRAVPQARKGPGMLAISAIDNALWDARGRCLDVPVWRLLGGPTRREVPLYASMLGYSLESELVRQRVREFVDRGFRGLKWFFRYGPQHGREGMARNLELVRTVREEAGPDVNIMFDAWKSWDVPYALAMAERMHEYDVTWLEEPVQPDRISGYAAIRRASPIAIAGGEQEYTRWGAQALIEAGAVDYIQPDVFNAGGLSELAKIATLASVNNIKIMPHARANVSVHLVAALSPDVCPFQEDLVKSSVTNEFFLKHPPLREHGSMLLSAQPGLGMDLDETKIESDEVIAP
jgi:L-alanine-DL-glutamate epimerase-like enolase superfamily enzyme